MADRFLQDIRAALAEREFNFDSFEECVCNLLRDEFPGIVPIRGGDDAGMDGAIPSPDAQPLPVITTTSSRVLENLTRNLDRYVDQGGHARRALLATSRDLSPRRRRKLEERAHEKDFVLAQVFEGRDLAERLYHRPDLCHSLLGLTGQPAALSEIPLTRRPRLPIDLIGREADLDWLRAVQGDSVLVGEPGAGKTFVLWKLADEGQALFLASSDETAIANGLRRSSPAIVFVDDAHVDLRQVALLRRLRQEVQAEFAIVATTWPWDRFSSDVAEALGGISSSNCRSLERLTRDEIVEVVHQVGVRAPVQLVRAIVDQARGKPGLAVTLALLCLQGEYESVVKGDALSRNLLAVFRQQVGAEAASVLACFAMGGEKGLAHQAVARILGLSLAQIRETVTAMAAGGVPTIPNDGVLAVEPLALRAALVRDEVLGGAAPLGHEQLIDVAEDRTSAVDALVAGLAYGATIDPRKVHAYVLSHGSRRAWQTLAAFSRQEAIWALANCRERLVDVASSALHSAPDLAIESLLRAAEEGDASEVRVFDAFALWLKDPDVTRFPLLERRRMLAHGAVSYMKEGGVSWIFWRALQGALSLSIESATRDPGMGSTISYSPGRLCGKALADLAALWPEVRRLATEMDGLTWNRLRRLLRPWLDLGYTFPHVPVTEEAAAAASSFLREVLEDLAPRFADQPGPASQIRRIGLTLGIDLGLAVDPEFELLYPSDCDYSEASDERKEAMRLAVLDLARGWAVEEPADVAERLAWYEQQAHEAGRLSPRLSPELASELSRLVNQPEEWISPMAMAAVGSDLLLPFVDRVMERDPALWRAEALSLLEQERYSSMIAERILGTEPLSMELVDRALMVTDRDPQLARILCYREGTLTPIRERLLHREEPQARLAAVVGYWQSRKRRGGDLEIEGSWRSAVLNCPSTEAEFGELVSSSDYEFWLGKILASDSDLAFRWIKRRLDEFEGPFHLSREGVFSYAIGALDQNQRLLVLESVDASQCPRGLIALLVGRDAVLYTGLLSRPDLREFHRVPLQGRPDERWWDLAKVAADRGFDPAEIADAALYSSWVVVTSGTGLDRWRSYEEAFSREEGSSDAMIRSIAEVGLRLARERLKSANKRQRQRALDGFH